VLDVRIRHRLGSFTLEASLAVPLGSVTVVVGESGSGKTTLLRLIAGLRDPDEGRIELAGRALFDRAANTRVPVEERPIGYVSQDYSLFPHLSARDNVAFGLRASGRSRRESRDRADRALDRLGMLPLAARRPDALSGGQRQRVALARALVLDPDVLLLDEPLSALDLMTRREVRGELRRTLDALPCATVFVTHQPHEALGFGERIVVLEQGRVTQQGSRADFVHRPRSRYVAEFLGVNLFEGAIAGPTGDGLVRVDLPDGALAIADAGLAGVVRLIVHPHDIVLSREAPAGSAVNVLRGPVEDVIPEPPDGDLVRVVVATRPALIAQVTRRSAESLGVERGAVVFASFKASGVRVITD
jgi:molybdate transport system ATP-binding protein